MNISSAAHAFGNSLINQTARAPQRTPAPPRTDAQATDEEGSEKTAAKMLEEAAQSGEDGSSKNRMGSLEQMTGEVPGRNSGRLNIRV